MKNLISTILVILAMPALALVSYEASYTAPNGSHPIAFGAFSTK